MATYPLPLICAFLAMELMDWFFPLGFIHRCSVAFLLGAFVAFVTHPVVRPIAPKLITMATYSFHLLGAFLAPVELYTAEEFDVFGCLVIGCLAERQQLRKQRFLAYFGVTPDIAAILWRELASSGWLRFVSTRNPEHLLWALLFLKRYDEERIHASLVNVCEEAFRRWSWFYAKGLANLDSKWVGSASSCFQ